MQIIRRDGLAARPWKNGGGVTREIACWPPGSGLDDFDWRISTAEVSADGPFSSFPGIDRTLFVLAGAGLELRFAGSGSRRLERGAQLGFAGEEEVFGLLVDGPVTDLNIMVRRGRQRMRAGQMRVSGATQVSHPWGTAALFVLDGGITLGDAVAGRHDTLLLEGAGAEGISGAAELLLIGFEALA